MHKEIVSFSHREHSHRTYSGSHTQRWQSICVLAWVGKAAVGNGLVGLKVRFLPISSLLGVKEGTSVQRSHTSETSLCSGSQGMSFSAKGSAFQQAGPSEQLSG